MGHILLTATCLLVLFPTHSLLVSSAASANDFTLVCNPGFGVSAIRRVNSAHQTGKAGSLSIDCQMVTNGSQGLVCEKLSAIPHCHGQLEGCSGHQWLGGFHAYAVGNDTSAVM